ncbi:MAG: hypothetical protein RR139_02055 [Lachnospiraceae bacterium]
MRKLPTVEVKVTLPNGETIDWDDMSEEEQKEMSNRLNRQVFEALGAHEVKSTKKHTV